MRLYAITVLLSACAAREVPVVAVSKPPAVEPCPEPQPVDTALATPARYETRTIGGAASGPRYTGRAIDLDVKDADIHNLCRLFADVGHVNIVLGDGVQGNVTLSMKRVPWDQAFAAVIDAKGFRAERDGNVIMVFAK